MAEITINAWGKTATVTYPDVLEGVGPAAFVALAGEDEIPDGISDAEFAISRVVGFVTDTIKAAAAKQARQEAQLAADSVAEQTDQISVEVV